MNAKVGHYNTRFEEIMGKKGMGKMNENGELFSNACASYGNWGNYLSTRGMSPSNMGISRLKNRKPNRP